MSRLKVVFVVDPDPVSRRETVRTLLRPGWSFRSCDDAHQLWADLEQLRPDLVVAELALPGVDGIALSRALHQRDPSIRTILVAGGEMPDVARRALREGIVDGLAAKPLNGTFVRMARQLLGESPLDDTAAFLR